MATWEEKIISNILCPGTVDNITELNNFITLQRLKRLLALDSTALDADNAANNFLKKFQSDAQCGTLYEDFILKQYLAIIEYKIAGIDTTPEEVCPYVFASGAYSDNPNGTSATISIPGMLATDIVVAVFAGDYGATITSIAPAADQVVIDFSGSIAEIAQINYIVIRPCEVEE